MSDDLLTRLTVAERNVKALEKRLNQVEEEMALCLRALRVMAEDANKRRNVVSVAAPAPKKEPS